MDTFSALLALCERNPLATGEFPPQRPVTRSFAIFFDPRLNKRLSKELRRWWFKTPLGSLWRHCNGGVNLVSARVAAALLCFSECQGFRIALCWRYPKYPTRSHGDVIKWNYFSCYCPFVREIHRSPVNSPHKGTVMQTLMFLRCRSA